MKFNMSLFDGLFGKRIQLKVLQDDGTVILGLGKLFVNQITS